MANLKEEESLEIHKRLRRQLDASLEKVKTVKKSSTFEGSMAIKQIPYDFTPVSTSVPLKELQKVMNSLSTWPDDFNINPKIKRQVEAKMKKLQVRPRY